MRAVLLLGVLLGLCTAQQEDQFKEWIAAYNARAAVVMFTEVDATWNFQTNITDHNEAIMLAASGVTANFTKTMSAEMAARFKRTDLTDPKSIRVFDKLTKIGDAALPADQFEELAQLKTSMEGVYSTAKICRDSSVTDLAQCPAGQVISLDPEITAIMDTSRDEPLLKHVWKAWRDATGPQMRQNYIKYIELKNAGARANGYANAGQAWRSPYVEAEKNYTDADFLSEIDDIWQKMKPLYQELHAFIRGKLRTQYPDAGIEANGPIPAHLMGNMWGQTWLGLLNFTQLYPHRDPLDVTAEMQRQNYTALRMFQLSDKFFTDLGLDKMPEEFWSKSMLVKPDGREVTCHASAWDFYNAKDFRVKQCTVVNMQDLFTVHHEMGHVEYFLLYKDQWLSFRDGANDGFHEAIGDVLSLSVSTPAHLSKIGLLPANANSSDTEMDLNFMFSTALEKISFLPFGLLMDMYRYEVFDGTIGTDELNGQWWKKVLQYQGLCSPVSRSENDFDPGSKYHIPADVPYMRYFVSFIIQFQFHEALCRAANHTGPLYTCDIDGSKAAGAMMRDALSKGSSEPWQNVMKVLTGQEKMDARPLIEFFEPLLNFLRAQNAQLGNVVGWTNNSYCAHKDSVEDYLTNEYPAKASKVIYDAQEAAWAYNTNITDENEKLMNAANAVGAAFDKEVARRLRGYNVHDSDSEDIHRMYGKLTKLGDAGLPEDKFAELMNIGNRMSRIYSTAKVCNDTLVDDIADCPTNQQMPLDPDITAALSKSRDPDYLLHLWTSWRDQSGKHMRKDYERYVELKNEGARLDNYANNAEAWRSPYVEPEYDYTDKDFLKNIDDIWNELRPFYQELHAYVRHKLSLQYKGTSAPLSSDGPIPAHLLGNMWAQTWGNILDFTVPYAGKPSLDVTDEMVKQGYNPMKMFQLSDKFFTDLGLERMPFEFWNKSMIVKPNDGREVTCHASAWDFYNQKDFRIKQCTVVTMEDLLTVHHEMGHVEYYLLYKNQPIPFRRGGNDGFHEAVGDTLSLSVSTPAHLQKIGLLNATTIVDEQMDINYMLSTALEKIAFLPFGLMLDMYRYDIFSGAIKPAEYNAKWWQYVTEYQGLCSPVARSEQDFDAGAKYHVPADVPYMRYFVSFIIQFQFHEAACHAAGYQGPLHKCDIDGSTAAGALLREGLQLGSSKPWQYAMQKLTGSESMNASSLLNFFGPVRDWLTKYITDNKLKTGWTNNTVCAGNLKNYLTNIYPQQAEKIYYEATETSWAYNTNMTDYNKDAMDNASVAQAAFKKEVANTLKTFDVNNLSDDEFHMRMYQKLSKLGDAALSEEHFAELMGILNRMQKTYSTAQVCSDMTITDIARCPEERRLDLEPGITQALATNRDPAYLLHLWQSWRDQSGKHMRTDYTRYVQLKNEAAVADGYKDNAEVWRAPYVEPSYSYTDADFLTDIDAVWAELKPFYQELHAYVRHRLMQKYAGTSAKLTAQGPIPAHLLGNMWAQTWGNIFDFTEPHPGKTSLDVTPAMKEQGYNAKRMFELSDKFFEDLGLEKMPELFWNKSMLEKPADGRDVICHASAWDFYNRKDFRVKQCTDVNMEDLMTVHHEMGHVEYFLLYKDLPIPFREGANDGFHEAVGDVISLSVATPAHLKKVGLLPVSTVVDQETNENFMLNTALDKIAFLPFGLMLDMYRFEIFSGKINKDNYNTEWWKKVNEYQGLCAPVARSEADFDAGAKFHVPADVPYMRYFVSFIIQFQFHEAVCREAGHTGPLYQCDIDGNKAAGQKLRNALKLGSSKPWQFVMKELTGGEKMSAQPMLEFFHPIRTWLQEYIATNRLSTTWTEETTCLQSGATSVLKSITVISIFACAFLSLFAQFAM